MHESPAARELLHTFGRLGLLSFGGPAGQIALMHRLLVDEKRWITEREFLAALNFCMLLPGPEAMQLATYCGWKLKGWKGGLAAGLLFVLPGSALLIALAALYVNFGALALVASAFAGVKAAVLAILAQALIRMGGRALKSGWQMALAALAFIAIAFGGVPFALILAVAGLAGFLLSPKPQAKAEAFKPRWRSLAATIALWLAIWLGPVALLLASLGPSHVLSRLALFFSKIAVITFGGAYAILSVVADEAVRQGWLTTAQMIDGLGLAETTPGPLILVLLFVGYLAAGLPGAITTLWVTFAPCFMWIFALGPYIRDLEARPRLAGALSGITAAVIGIIANLGFWFGLHTLTGWQPIMLALAAAFLLFRLKWGIVALMAAMSVASIALSFIPG